MRNDVEGEQATRTLYLLRHAKSSWRHPVDDHERPLSDRGVRDADAAGRLFAERGWWPDLVLCSTALRTRQTWDRAAATGARAGEVRYLERIYGATVDELLGVVHEIPEDVGSCLVVGHAPGLPDLASRLSGPLHAKFGTAGLAVLRLTDPWASVETGELLSFDLPHG